jgi:plasmid segregation protein ParM
LDHFFGVGNPTVDIDKIDAPINKIGILSSIAMCGSNEYYIVVGLPITQYKAKKERLRNMVMSYNGCDIIYNGRKINYHIRDVGVCPQGIGALYTINSSSDRILFDIGSYTINVALIEYSNGNPKIIKSDTWYSGVLNLYQRVIEEINRKFDLTLKPSYAEKVLSTGELSIDGSPCDLKFLKPIISDYLDPVFTQFKLKYDEYKTVPTTLIGGGAELLHGAFERTVKNCEIIEDSQFANALGYHRYGIDKFICR